MKKYSGIALSLIVFLGMSSTPAFCKVLRVGVASGSAVKMKAALKAFEEFEKKTRKNSDVQDASEEVKVEVVKFPAESGIASQPVGEFWGKTGALNRLAGAIAKKTSDQQIDYWVSMENFIEKSKNPGFWIDRAAVIVQQGESKNSSYTVFSEAVEFPESFVLQAELESKQDYEFHASGYSKTVGEVIHERLGLPADDWHSRFGRHVGRGEILQGAIVEGLSELLGLRE